MADSVSYQSLMEKFELTKKELGEAEETIRRITGRDPDQLAKGAPGVVKWKNTEAGAGRQFPPRKRPLFPIGKAKEEESEPMEEESPDEDGPPADKKPSVQSTVVATPKDVKSRKETIQEQNVNSKVTARNRRMLGMILGTLQKFQREETKRKQQVLKRAEIEQKVEAAAEEEKERIKREKEELFLSRKEKQIQLRCLEKKLEIAEVHEVWESNQKHMLNFIRTKAKPELFFLPATHNENSEKCLEESRNKTLEIIKQERQKMENELQEVEEWYKKDSFRGDKENIGPEEEAESQETQETGQENTTNTTTEVENAVLEDEEKNTDKNMENLTDQEFEPIYD